MLYLNSSVPNSLKVVIDHLRNNPAICLVMTHHAQLNTHSCMRWQIFTDIYMYMLIESVFINGPTDT